MPQLQYKHLVCKGQTVPTLAILLAMGTLKEQVQACVKPFGELQEQLRDRSAAELINDRLREDNEANKRAIDSDASPLAPPNARYWTAKTIDAVANDKPVSSGAGHVNVNKPSAPVVYRVLDDAGQATAYARSIAAAKGDDKDKKLKTAMHYLDEMSINVLKPEGVIGVFTAEDQTFRVAKMLRSAKIDAVSVEITVLPDNAKMWLMTVKEAPAPVAQS
jgi:hypothetical protein